MQGRVAVDTCLDLGTHKLRHVCGRRPAQDSPTGTPNASLDEGAAHGVLQLSSVREVQAIKILK